MKMTSKSNFAVIVPMANEANDFSPFISSLCAVLDRLESGKVYLVYTHGPYRQNGNPIDRILAE
jgi:hypothetical protein